MSGMPEPPQQDWQRADIKPSDARLVVELSRADAQALYDHTGTMPWAPEAWTHRVRAVLSAALATVEPTLAQVVSAFIVQARDKYGLGRFMPDELPLLDEMARLARIELGE